MFYDAIIKMQKQRDLTEEEHIKLVEIGDQFWNQFSKIAAEAISQFPEEIECAVISYLQDKCSIYGSCCDEFIKR